MTTTRRDFLKRTATASAAITTPFIFTAERARAEDANSRKTIASIGVGGPRAAFGRGGKIAAMAAGLGQIIAVCDVDTLHNAKFNERYGGNLSEYTDYRELFAKEKPDLVTIGTPDHWHVPIAIAAMRAGCDVYCEKPLTLTIEEGQRVCEVVKQTGRVFQVGTQQRTEYGNCFLKAVAMVQSGMLGDNVKAYAAIGEAPPNAGDFEPTDVPEGLDWDRWLGPAAKVPYMEQRRKAFRWFFEYSGGKMTDWRAHHIDIAQWALGKSDTSPVEIAGTATFPDSTSEKLLADPVGYLGGDVELPHGFTTACTFDIDLKFADGALIHVTNDYASEDGKTKFGNGILFVGSRGRIFVNRGGLRGAPVEDLTDADKKKLDDLVVKLYKGRKPTSHMADFFHCVDHRDEKPIADVFTHHRTMTSCHLCNIAILLGRKLRYDPVAQNFGDDKVANSMLTRKRRAPYDSIDG